MLLDMLRTRNGAVVAIILFLIVANLIRWFFSDWGLITVTVHEAPLGQIVKSIERQGWVKIYTDIDPSTPVSMYVVKVPLAEAMETLVANLPNGGQWKLGFFAAPSSAAVKNEISAFQSGNLGDDAKVFSFPTPLQMLDTDSDMPAADPRLQTWPGMQPPPPAPAANAVADNSGNNPQNPAPAAPADPPGPPTVQDYFTAFAQGADIWIVAPGSWTPVVSKAPAPSSSIISAVENLVSSAHGSVQQAIILQARGRRQGGPRGGGGFGGGDTGWVMTQDRIKNAINGLPEEARPQALAQLTAEVSFMQNVQAAPPDQRRAMMRDHFMNHRRDNSWRQSPEKRAQRYSAAVSNRIAARGK
jgi:hypothetical protein